MSAQHDRIVRVWESMPGDWLKNFGYIQFAEALIAEFQLESKQEPVGTVERMPGTTGFGIAVFENSAVPIGTALYTQPLASLPSERPEAEDGWISIAARLPELGQSVALIDADGWENTGGDLQMNVRACGYLEEMGSTPYWAIRGERAKDVNAFTHWLALPALAASQGAQE